MAPGLALRRHVPRAVTSVRHGPWSFGTAGGLRLAERDGLRALPEGQLAECRELLLALDEGGEVVGPQLAGLRREVAIPVGEQQLGLALAARVQRQLAGVGVRRRVLGADPQVAVAPRDPVRLA